MKTKKLASSFALFLAIILVACRPAQPENPFSAETRQAVITTVVNRVTARSDKNQEFAQAKPGYVLPVGGQAQSGDESRARFDLTPDGTIIRLGPNSIFELITLEEQDAVTRLKLVFGELWIILNGGTLEVESESGQAAVRGSYLGLILSPDSGSLKALCLEGHCTLSNELGSVELTDGQAAEIPAPGEPPSLPRPMTNEEIQRWLEASPEAGAIVHPANPPHSQPTIAGPPQNENPPGSTPPANNLPPPPGGGNRSSTYELNNTCPEVWHWKFEGPTTILLDLNPGESVSGILPPGDYQATDWFNNGTSHGPNFLPGGGNLNVTSCPDSPNGP